MPKFYEKKELYIDPIDFLEKCDSGEIEKIIDHLEEMGSLKNYRKLYTPYSFIGLLEEEFQKSIQKISESRHRITLEEEEIIKKISGRL